MLTKNTYRGVVQEDGSVRLQYAPALPVGAKVMVVVAQSLSSITEQVQRLITMPEDEWLQAFEQVEEAWEISDPAPDENNMPDNEALASLVHEVRSKI